MDKKRVFIDLDHVVVDFNGGFYNIFGIELNESGYGMLPEDWELINMIPEFYYYLPKFNYADDLLNKIESKVSIENMFFLTSSPPEYAHNAYLDKTNWVRDNIRLDIPILFNNKVFGKENFIENGRNDILIDDKVICTHPWFTCGGTSILFQEGMGENLKWVDERL